MTEKNENPGLWALHGRLAFHFRTLNERRKSETGDAPVFALEHGLSGPELDDLKRQVRSALHRDLKRGQPWLPFIVYAAEVGYEYSGDAYWPVFQEQTPNWSAHGNRRLIRDWFEQFAEEFGGAVPTGRWSDQFSIIAWPITHALLPQDLQTQLARLLFESRHVLNAEIVADPLELGFVLASRAHAYSARFRYFADSPKLLGFVASALLVGDDEKSPYVLPATLHRIVGGLSREGDAHRWLATAKSAVRQQAGTVLTTPGRPGGKQLNDLAVSAPYRPQLLLSQTAGVWSMSIGFSGLAQVLDAAGDTAEAIWNHRAILNGSNRKLPGGALLRSTRPERLPSWPSGTKPLVQLENAPDAINSALAKEIVFPLGPTWPFVLHPDGRATGQVARRVRADGRYLVVVDDERRLPPIGWAKQLVFEPAPARAFHLTIPRQLEAADLTWLALVGLELRSEISVGPVGVVPRDWDGSDSVTWGRDDPHLLRIQSSQLPGSLAIVNGGRKETAAWPTGQRELYLDLGPLSVGVHEIELIVDEGSENPGPSIQLHVSIDDPDTVAKTGEPGQGLRILSSRSMPYLSGLWDGVDVLDLIGPDDTNADVRIGLESRSGALLASESTVVRLPVIATTVARILGDSRMRSLRRSFDRAEGLSVQLSIPGVGAATLVAEREFQGLRWVISQDRDQLTAILANNTDLDGSVHLYAFGRPVEPIEQDPTRPVALPPLGAMLIATAGSLTATITVPPSPNAVHENANTVPQVPDRVRNQAEIMELLLRAGQWSTAYTAGDPITIYQRRRVIRAITAAIVGSVSRSKWAAFDASVSSRLRPFDQHEAQQALLRSGISPSLVASSRATLNLMTQRVAVDRVALFASLIHEFALESKATVTRYRLAELLLMGASDPSRLHRELISQDQSDVLSVFVARPKLFILARFIVLALDDIYDDGSGIFGDWVWV